VRALESQIKQNLLRTNKKADEYLQMQVKMRSVEKEYAQIYQRMTKMTTEVQDQKTQIEELKK
jgi:predicted nuclease with TOPRIM domain